MKALYTAHAVSTGDGRNGHVAGGDGLIDFDVRMPPELGGSGGAPNPELLPCPFGQAGVQAVSSVFLFFVLKDVGTR